MSQSVHVAGVTVYNPKYEILLLLKNKDKPEGGNWGPPGGRIEKGENPLDAVHRELKEETEILASTKKLTFEKTFYWSHKWKGQKYLITYESFTLKLDAQLKIKLDKTENTKYLWLEPQKAYLKDDLMKGMYIILEYLYGFDRDR